MTDVGDWDYREVCPDGACIGVIGTDGLCKVCGRAAPNWGSERLRGLAADEDDKPSDADVDADADDQADDQVDAAPHTNAAGGDAWDRRELCSNGACVGVIGDDGRCTVCGSPPG